MPLRGSVSGSGTPGGWGGGGASPVGSVGTMPLPEAAITSPEFTSAMSFQTVRFKNGFVTCCCARKAYQPIHCRACLPAPASVPLPSTHFHPFSFPHFSRFPFPHAQGRELSVSSWASDGLRLPDDLAAAAFSAGLCLPDDLSAAFASADPAAMEAALRQALMAASGSGTAGGGGGVLPTIREHSRPSAQSSGGSGAGTPDSTSSGRLAPMMKAVAR